MDAREQLRRYLEQRRELGEQDLVLDGMAVDEVLRLVGAIGHPASTDEPGTAISGRTPGFAGERGPSSRATAGPQHGQGAGPAVGGDRPAGGAGDWRTILRAAAGSTGGADGSPMSADGEAGGGAGTSDASAPARVGEVVIGTGTAEERMARARSTAKRGAPSGSRGADGSGPGAAAGPAGSAGELPEWLVPLGLEAGLVVGGGLPSDPDISRLPTLDAIARATEKCTRCQLYRTATHAVPGEGNPHARLVCVGEAPGANEDASGRPFVGAAGQLLTKILEAIKLTREEVFICNVIKHRPPGNRNPEPGEVEACSPYLLRQLELIRPAVILTLGSFAAQTLLATRTPIGKLRGRVHLYNGTPLVVTYHPAALLRNPAWKRPTWEDVQLARRILDSAPDA